MILSRTKILMVDSDFPSIETTIHYLEEHNFRVLRAENARDGLQEAETCKPELIIVDANLADVSGFKLLSSLKASPSIAHIPVVFHSSQAGEMDRIIGLELGAEDYIAKPCNPRELGLKIRRILSRHLAEAPQVPDELRVRDLRLIRSKVEVRAGRRAIHLAALEFKLLALLMERAGQVQPHEKLLGEVWGYNLRTSSRTLYTHIDRLRSKLGRYGTYIENVRNVGFRMKNPDENIEETTTVGQEAGREPLTIAR
jgi:DNA-binding response OmpR family regulator